MFESEMEKLQSQLSANGRELLNVKFFPGDGKGLTSEAMAEEAAAALEEALMCLRDEPPLSGLEPTFIDELFPYK